MKNKSFVSFVFLWGFAAANCFSEDRIPLAIATMDHPHTRAIREGKIEIPECRISYSTASRAGLGRLIDQGAAGDVIEVDLMSYLQKFSTEESHDWVLVPVFLSRAFPHRHAFVVSKTSVTSLGDLAGKSVGVDSPSKTMEVWLRGIVSSSSPATAEYIVWDPSIFSSTAPRRQLYADAKTVEQEYFKSTRIFPIITVLALRRELAAANPWLPEALFLAFSEAKDQALEEGFLPLPWGPEAKEQTIELMGKNYWSYGVKNNPKTLDALFKFGVEQGLIKKELTPDQVFAPETLHLIDDKGAKN